MNAGARAITNAAAPGCGPYPYGGARTMAKARASAAVAETAGRAFRLPMCTSPWKASACGAITKRKRQDIVTGGSTLNTGDFQFGFRNRPTHYRRRAADENRCLGNHLLRAELVGRPAFVLTGTADLSLPGDSGTPQACFFSGADSMIVTYSSEIHSAEFNYIWHERGCECNSLSFLVGFRYFHLDEDLDITSTVTGESARASTTPALENDLYGAKLGLRWKRCCP